MARRARKLGFYWCVANWSDLETNPKATERDAEEFDEDGDVSVVGVSRMSGEAWLSVEIRRGTSPIQVAKKLRRIADRIEREGNTLLNMDDANSGGTIRQDGTIEWTDDVFGIERDENGEPIIPDIE